LLEIKKILSPVFLLGFLFSIFFSANSQTPDIVFVSRNITSNGNAYYPQSSLLPGMGSFSRFKVVGGKLLVRESNTIIRTLVDSTINFGGISLVDVADPCVHWDGLRIIFSGVEHRDSSWRIYEIRSDGSNFRKVTFSNRVMNLSQFGAIANKFVKYDDIDPCYLPDGRICFSSTRYPSLSEMGTRTTNLYIMNSNLSNLHRITTERNSAEEPTIDLITGRIVYSRWWLNIDMPSHLTQNGLTRDSAFALVKDVANIWQVASIRPDGDALDLFAGLAGFRQGLHNYKPSVTSDGKLLSVFIPHTPMFYTSGSPGIRWFDRKVNFENHINGVNMRAMQLYVPSPPSTGTMVPPYATDPNQLPDGRIIYSFATQVENQDYAVYTINLSGSGSTLLFDVAGKMDLEPQPLVSRIAPPILPDLITDISDELPPTIDPLTYFKNGGFRFDCLNMFTNADVDVPMPDAPPITKNAKIKFFLNFQRMDSLGKDTSILLAVHQVQYSGTINFDFAPADVSMFEQVVDSANKTIIGTQNQTAHVIGMNFGRPGSGTKCVGCHAGHTTIFVPPTITQGQFFNTSTSATVTQSSFVFVNDSVQYPGKKVIDRKANNDTQIVNWIANGTNNEFVQLSWDVPIDFRYVKLYNIKKNLSNNTNIDVTDCELVLYYQNKEVYRLNSTGPITSSGTQINIPGFPKTDKMKVTVKTFTGLINGQSRAGLAEVETNARISYYDIYGIIKLSEIAENFSLSQNYPNPFNPITSFKFQVSSLKFIKLTVFDVLGREVKILVKDKLNRGTYKIDFDGSNLSSGIYFYTLEADNKLIDSKKMVLLK